MNKVYLIFDAEDGIILDSAWTTRDDAKKRVNILFQIDMKYMNETLTRLIRENNITVPVLEDKIKFHEEYGPFTLYTIQEVKTDLPKLLDLGKLLEEDE